MANAFSQLPRDASLDKICGQAGKVFAARKVNNPQTNFNTEIWYLAGDAMSTGFSALRGMTKEQVARAMGDSISRYINPGMGNYISAYGFGSLSWSASLSSIYGQAGRIFEEQVRNHPETDYTRPEAFDKAVWHIAEKACDRGFLALQDMSTRDVASGMGNYISAYIAAQRHGGITPLVFAALFAAFAALGVFAIVQPHWILVLAIKATALAHAHPQLTANMLITAAQKVIGGETPAKVAKAVAISAGGAIVEPQLQSWLAGLKINSR